LGGLGGTDGRLGARVRRTDDVVGETLHRGGQRPRVGGGSGPGEAEHNGGRGGRPGRQGPRRRPPLPGGSPARASWRGKLLAEQREGFGFSRQFVTRGLASQFGKGLHQRAQFRRYARGWFRAREQGCHGRLRDHGLVPVTWR